MKMRWSKVERVQNEKFKINTMCAPKLRNL